jgi:matrixin
MKRLILTVAIALVCASCQKSKSPSPTGPDPVTPPPSSNERWTLTGQVIDALTQQPIGGAQLLNTQTDSAGLFEATGSGTRSAQRVTLAASGFLTRETTISSGTNNPIIDLIPMSLSTIYRQLVRNGFEAPSELEPIRRWMASPDFYINTSMPIGIKVLEGDLQRIEEGIRSSVPSFTGGKLQVSTLVRGTNPPNDKGWIVVSFINDSTADFCGRAYVGADPGAIEFNYNRCTCGNVRVRSGTIAHEVGHALGFWHTADKGTLMFPVSSGCGAADVSQPERDAARIAYARPVMNSEPDKDPTGAAFANPASLGPAKRVTD